MTEPKEIIDIGGNIRSEPQLVSRSDVINNHIQEQNLHNDLVNIVGGGDVSSAPFIAPNHEAVGPETSKELAETYAQAIVLNKALQNGAGKKNRNIRKTKQKKQRKTKQKKQRKTKQRKQRKTKQRKTKQRKTKQRNKRKM
tara:strand:+ start:112 stop:534 length:423 start_codon:yes stop_codon:yes gene_type:complete